MIDSNAYSQEFSTIEETIHRQVCGDGAFICRLCVHWLNGTRCAKNVFITAVGVDLSNCVFFERGHRCIHCGKMSSFKQECFGANDWYDEWTTTERM